MSNEVIKVILIKLLLINWYQVHTTVYDKPGSYWKRQI